VRSSLAIVALIAAAVGAVGALAIARAAGWVGRPTTRTVVVSPPAAGGVPDVTAAHPRVAPVVQGSFSPAKIYASRAPGVVTLFSYFGGDAASGAQGSGFVISPSGTILTNAHVITNAGENGAGASVHQASRVYVEFPDHDRIPARIVGWDVFDDVGVLQVDPKLHPLTVVPLGHSDTLVVGQPVAAIGSPLGNEDSLAVGVVSALHRSIASLTSRYQLVDAIQTDAAFTHGSSGGPLLDAKGRAIGINAQIRSLSGQGNDLGVGFAVPIDSARRSVRALLRHGKVAYAYVGVRTSDVTPAVARALQLPVQRGALVERVTPGGPGAKAGIRGGTHSREISGESVLAGGDVVVAVDRIPVASADDLVRLVSDRLEPGNVAAFTVVRDGRRLTVPVDLKERPPNPGGP
jgi:S1-C subfamily serine protease